MKRSRQASQGCSTRVSILRPREVQKNGGPHTSEAKSKKHLPTTSHTTTSCRHASIYLSIYTCVGSCLEWRGRSTRELGGQKTARVLSPKAQRDFSRKNQKPLRRKKSVDRGAGLLTTEKEREEAEQNGKRKNKEKEKTRRRTKVSFFVLSLSPC